MATDNVLLGQLMRMGEPWAVREYLVDSNKRRIDLRIGIEVPRGWFGRPKSTVVESAPRTWRHLDVLGLRCFVHVHAPVNADLGSLSWTGAPDQPFTRAMARSVFNLLNEGMSLEGICTICSISLDELWRFKYALDNGRAGFQPASAGTVAPQPGTKAAPAQATRVGTAPAPANSDGDVPDVSDPVWMALVSGRINPDIRVLSFKLLLTRIRTQMDIIQDDEVRMLKLRELHRYFVKNARMLVHELAQIRRAQS